MPAPTTKDGILHLAGKLNAQSRFISKLIDRCAPFFKALKQSKTIFIEWTPECEQAFQGIEYLASVPMLSKPKDGEIFYLYLVVSNIAVSAALIHQEDHKELQVYYLAKGFTDAETRYPALENLALALVVVVAQQLRPYFQSHSVHVLKNFSLK